MEYDGWSRRELGIPQRTRGARRRAADEEGYRQMQRMEATHGKPTMTMGLDMVGRTPAPGLAH